jgi:hypothetical protein
VKRKRLTQRQKVVLWEKSEGKCWRCEQPIVNGIEGDDWVLGHCNKPHWMGGVDVAPEHTACNSEDGKVQTTLAAKSVRIRARNAGIKKRSLFGKPYKPEYTPGRWHVWFDENGRERSTWIPPTLVGDKGH